MNAPTLPSPSGTLREDVKGMWWLVSREDWTQDGQQRIDPILGADPIGVLSYGDTHFAAQFMKRERNTDTLPSTTGQNNTTAVNGYDAYFGTYDVNEETGQVAHTLVGSITPANVGMRVMRDLRVSDKQLVIQLQTTTPDGEQVTRTLVWRCAS